MSIVDEVIRELHAIELELRDQPLWRDGSTWLPRHWQVSRGSGLAWRRRDG